jgi:hypothetical protein
MGIKVDQQYTSTGRTWLDSGGYFLFGKYKNGLAEDVAKDDPSYVKWIVETVEDICEDDREVLSQLLTHRRRNC